MPDLLVKLYELDLAPAELPGVTIRRPMPHEAGTVRRWVARTFGEGWGDEFACSFKSFPVTSYVALRNDAVVGFATYEATSRGYFGPTGVLESERGRGIDPDPRRTADRTCARTGGGPGRGGAGHLPERSRQIPETCRLRGEGR